MQSREKKKLLQKKKVQNRVVGSILLLLCLFYIKGDVVGTETEMPQLCVRWEGIRSVRPVPASPEMVNIAQNSPVEFDRFQEKLSPENELYGDEKICVSFEIAEECFAPEWIQMIIEEIDYDSGKKKDVTTEYYKAGGDWEKDGEKYIYRLFLKKEGHYRFQMSCRDGEGNALTVGEEEQELYIDDVYTSPVCTIDKTRPKIVATSLQGTSSCSDGKTSYYNEVPVLMIQIAEENFCSGDFIFQDMLSWADESVEESLTGKDYNLKWTSEYKDGKRVNTVTVPIRREGNHVLKGMVEDAVHLRSEDYTICCTYDAEKPQIVCELNSDHSEDIIKRKYSTDFFFGKKEMQIKVTVRDRISGIAGVHMILIDKKTGEEWENAVKVVKKTSVNEGEQEWIVSLDRDVFHGTFAVTTEDRSGLKSRRYESEEIVLETETAHLEHSSLSLRLPEADVVDEERKIKYYRRLASVEALAQDMFSGLYQVSLQAYEKTKTEEGNGAEKIYQKKEKGYYQQGGLRTNADRLKMNIRQDSYENSDADHPIYLEAELRDNAGNTTRVDSGEYGIVIDGTAPQIGVHYNTYRAENGSYYNRTRVALVTVRDRNFDPDSVKWKIQGSNAKYNIGIWKKSGTVWQCRIVFKEEGENYKIALSAADYVGNRTIWNGDRAFTIDKTAPKIQIKMSREGCRHEKYYRTEKKVYFVLQEKHYAENETNVLITRKIRGKEKLQKVEKRFHQEETVGSGKGENSNSIWVMEKLLKDDGEYKIEFSCRDLAGNQTTMASIPEFVIDRTSPVFKIRGVEQGMVYDGEVSPAIQCSDDYLDHKSVKISLRKLNGEPLTQEKYPSRKTKTPSRIRRYWEAFTETLEKDGIYLLRMEAEDYAGNRITLGKGIRFYVNRYGARYQLGEELEKVVKKGYKNGSGDLVIEEWSVTDTETQLTILKDNEEKRVLQKGREAGEGMDYTVEVSREKEGERKGWTKKRYQIAGKNFEEEGLYRIILDSRGYVDTAKGRVFAGETSNEMRGKEIVFMVDQTPPVVKLGNLDQKIYKGKKHVYTVTAMDNGCLEKLCVTVHYLDGSRADDTIVIKEEELGDMHSIRQELQAHRGLQRISYEAWDEAGNRICSEENGDSRVCLVTEGSGLLSSERKSKMSLQKILAFLMIFCVSILTARQFFDIVSKRRNR